MLSLTDMWKAAGADEAKRPAEWLRHDATVEFVEMVAASNMGGTHIQTRRGNNGGTYAHWQIGLAYAKYLSPGIYGNEMVAASFSEVSEKGGRVQIGLESIPPFARNMLREHGRDFLRSPCLYVAIDFGAGALGSYALGVQRALHRVFADTGFFGDEGRYALPTVPASIFPPAFKRRSLRRLTEKLGISPDMPVSLVLGQVRTVQVFGDFPQLSLHLWRISSMLQRAR